MKKLFTKAIEWLRRRVTALKDTRSVYVNVNDDENHVKGYGLKVMGDSQGVDDNLVKVSGEGLEVSGETVASYPLLRTSFGTPPPCGHPLYKQRGSENDERLKVMGDSRGLDVNDGDNSSLKSEALQETSINSQQSSLNNANHDPLLLRIEEFIGEHYRVRFNALSQQHEISGRDAERWMPVSSMQCNRIVMELNRVGIILAKPYLVKTVIEGGTLAEEYHPVRNYLTSLPEWDGVERIEALFRRVTDDEQLLCWLRKWFIAMVAQALNHMGAYGNSVCPILISSVQGWGKSQFAKLLVPPQLRGAFTDTFNLQQEDGCLRRMTAYMLINVDEIDRFGDRRMATFKNMVQLATVSMKRAYHTQMEEKERMASFIATSNQRHLLNDESGSRRFICVELTHAIDVTTPLNHTQLYAEALAAIECGERCWFNEEETRELEAHNASFATSQGVWALMKRCLTLRDISEGNEERESQLYSASEVYDYLHQQSPSAMSGIERSTFGYFLSEFGAQQVRVKNKRVYSVCLANANDN